MPFVDACLNNPFLWWTSVNCRLHPITSLLPSRRRGALSWLTSIPHIVLSSPHATISSPPPPSTPLATPLAGLVTSTQAKVTTKFPMCVSRKFRLRRFCFRQNGLTNRMTKESPAIVGVGVVFHCSVTYKVFYKKQQYQALWAILYRTNIDHT